MGLIAKLFHKLASLTHGLPPKRDEIVLSVNAIVKRFNLLDEAKKLGALGLPPFHSKELSSVEQEVVRYIEVERERMKQDILSDIAQIDACIAETQTHQYDLKTGLLTADFEREALVILNKQSSWLDKLATSANNKLHELNTFKATHQLSREASYPDGAALFFRYALLLLLVSFEGVFNATFFAEGLSTGLLGGFFYAVTLASINVFTAFILGKTAVRWCFHIQPALKAVGIAALIITLSLTAFNALAIGHLRNAILLESASPTKDALQSLLMNPIGFNDLMAWVLFLVTIGFGIAAMIDGLFVDDLYPGYGNISRRTKSAVEEFEEEFEEVRAELEEIKQENMDALDAEIVKANQLLLRFAQQIEDKKPFINLGLKSSMIQKWCFTPPSERSDLKTPSTAMTRCCPPTSTPYQRCARYPFQKQICSHTLLKCKTCMPMSKKSKPACQAERRASINCSTRTSRRSIFLSNLTHKS